MTKTPNADPRRVLNTSGRLMVPLRSLNPGQQCAIKHGDGKYWYPYIIVAHDHGIDLGTMKLVVMPFVSVLRLELGSWMVPSDSMVYRVDPITEDLRGTEIKP